MSHSDFENYSEKLESDADDFVDQYFEDFISDVKDGLRHGAYDWIDSETGRLHEFVDQYITPREAIDILENCDNKETDTGLWEGIKDPLEAISSMGFWSYKNDLHSEIREKFVEKLEQVLEGEYEPKKERLEKEIDIVEDEIGKVETELDDLEDSDNIYLIEHYGMLKELYEAQLQGLEEKLSSLEDITDNIEKAISDLR